TLAAVVVSSICIWAFHFTVLRGVQQAAAINQIVTVAKVVPIILFILILVVSFNGHLFAANFWGGEGMPTASLFEQVRATMLVTVFVFIGIEGASVYSRYAQKRSDVGAATIFGFVAVPTWFARPPELFSPTIAMSTPTPCCARKGSRSSRSQAPS